MNLKLFWAGRFLVTQSNRRVLFVGWLSDITGSYDVAFYGAGVTIFLSGLMLFLAPCIGRIQRGERSASDGFDAHDCCCVVR